MKFQAEIVFFLYLYFMELSFLGLGKSLKESKEYPFKKTNLLFIMFDDLRPELSIYGRHHMITPNFERLAKRSVTFDYAFSQVSVCNPSRDSMLTGMKNLQKQINLIFLKLLYSTIQQVYDLILLVLMDSKHPIILI